MPRYFSTRNLAVASLLSLTILMVTLLTSAPNSVLSISLFKLPPEAPYITACGPNWAVVPSPNVGNYDNVLSGVAVLSADDAWAVGYSVIMSPTFMNQTLVEHWDGSTWTVVPGPNPGDRSNSLTAITAISANDVWAVGTSFHNEGADSTLITHWDGTSWSVVPSPNPGAVANGLNGIDAISGTDIWAVGDLDNFGTGSIQTLIEHWDGSSWTVVPSPNPGSYNHFLQSVSARASDDVWAVGYYIDSVGHTLTLIEHWDGSSWSKIPSPSPSPFHNQFASVAAISATDAWAVGFYRYGSAPPWDRPLIARWTGSSWNLVSDPNPPDRSFFLQGVAGVRSDDVWAVGYLDTYPDPPFPNIDHWNGSSWAFVFQPNVGRLNAVAPLSATDVWGVGLNLNGNTGVSQTFIARYNPCTASPTPTVTGTPPTSTPTAPPEPSASPTACPIQFVDVPQDSTFYSFIRCMACRGIVSGYSDNSFRPNNNVSRGQLAKIVSNSLGFVDSIPSYLRTFWDVPPNSTFWVFVERIYLRRIINGYPGDGTTLNPCTGQVEQMGRSYFRPCNNASRGQIAKIDAEAAGYSDTIPPGQQTFFDVPPANNFRVYIERVAHHGVINGYHGDGITINPCTGQVEQVGQQYFRPCNNATRGQTSKIVVNTYFPNCVP